MKRVIFVTMAITMMMLSFAACTLHVPYDFEWDSAVYRIILRVDPDDAEVLLNGKLIGYAYEFSTAEAAMRLASRNNELIIKKEGYAEEEINLHEYSSHKITIRMKLLEDKDYRPGPTARKPRPRRPEPKPPVPKPKDDSEERDRAYQPKKEKAKEIPMDEKEQKLPADKPVSVKITISPEEAAIYLDGKFWGLSPQSGKIENLRLKPGKYSLEVVKPGYQTYIKKLYIADQDLDLNIKLQKK